MNPESMLERLPFVGCGMVGATSAFALMEQGLFSELVLVDVNRERAEGEAMDIGHGMIFASPMNIYAGDYDDIMDASIIVIYGGRQPEGGRNAP